MKGIIPAAGSGTRLGPFTNAIPKELLPVGDKAVIEHVVFAFLNAGITDINIVVSPKKHGLSDYLGSGKRFGANFTYVIQDERLGLANAVAAAEHVSNGDPVAVILGDNFFYPETILMDLLTFHEQSGADATIGTIEVSDVTRHGIITSDGDRVLDLVEKPEPQNAASNIGIAGVYIFSPQIFDCIQKTKPGFKDEFQLTDSIKIMIEQGMDVRYQKINGIHIDVGTPEDLMRANEYYLSKK